MSKFLITFFLSIVFCLGIFSFIAPPSVSAQTPTLVPEYEPCLKGKINDDGSVNEGRFCPEIPPNVEYTCAQTVEEWNVNKRQNFWVNDAEVTALGKAGERSRQFLYWSLTHRSIDNHPSILSMWSFVKNMVYFFLLIVAAIFGLGMIIGNRFNFNFKLEVWPTIIKIGLLFLYVTLSASIVLLIIQLSDTLMLFFIERLEVTKLFNIFFLRGSGGSVIQDSETAYKTFQGCSNLNVNLLDSVKTSKFMVNITNMTYYMLGVMLILRKIILWLLLFVSPFLALLMPFVFIRNTGWIWIGVFFQWVFYGPLFALFLGGLAKIWNSNSHIPFNFDFSRTNSMDGFVYPTTINILYGGPAQNLDLLNSSNYADTFAEYIIALIMLWAVTFFPWWLLRIFRDYCCEGIYAMKNILLSMYDQTRGGPSPQPPGPTPTPTSQSTGTALKIPKEVQIPISIKLETIEEIRKTKTEDITRSLNLSVSKLTDIARFETDKQHHEAVNRNINLLQNPLKAETSTDRQKYMNIRSELFNRAVKEEKLAKQILSSLSSSRIEQVQKREELIKSISEPVPITRIISIKVKIPHEKVTQVTSQFIHALTDNNSMMSAVSQTSNVSQESVKTILTSYVNNVSKPTSQIINNLSKQTNLTKQQISNVIQNTSDLVNQGNILTQIAKQASTSVENIETMVQNISQVFGQTEQSIIQTVEQANHVSSPKLESIISTVINTTANNPTIQSQIQQVHNLNESQIHSIAQSFTQNLSQPSTEIINTVSNQTGIEKEKVKETITYLINNAQSDTVQKTATKENIGVETVTSVLHSTSETIFQRLDQKIVKPVYQIIEESTKIPIEKQISVIKNFFQVALTYPAIQTQIKQSTGLNTNQVNNIAQSFTQNLSQSSTNVVNNVSNQTGIEKEKIKKVVSYLVKTSQSVQDLIKETATKENIKEEQVIQVIKDQMPLVVNPEKNIEQTVGIPASISLDDYENVKHMWKEQYIKGEVPVSSTIQSRDQWIDKDIVFITNTLNKLVSESPELRQEGLDDIGYILPIFLINNLKGDELLVYLKAKLEAAKEVQREKEKEKELKEEMKGAKEEEFVEAKPVKKEEKEKEMKMENELEEKSNQQDTSNKQATNQKDQETNK